MQIREDQDKYPVLYSWKRQVLGEEKRKSEDHMDLSVKGGLLLKGEHIVIPRNLGGEVLEQIQTGHQGLVKSKQRANIGRGLLKR